MIFSTAKSDVVYLSRSDVDNVLSTFSHHAFELDGAEWPSVEHYYQAMKFSDVGVRMQVLRAPTAHAAQKLARKYRRQVRPDWNKNKQTIMTRGVYIKCRTHPEVTAALLSTGDKEIIETSQYDYYWGCGRDFRGRNVYGKVLSQVREKLRQIASTT